MQNAALRSAGIAVQYEALDVEPHDLPQTLRRLATESAGGNVTIPHKEAAVRGCARITSVAERVGAVNTFWTDRGQLVGDNTDVAGFDTMVRAVVGARPAGARVALFGAGGAAAAVCAAVEEWEDGRVALFARTSARSAALAARFPRVVRTAGTTQAALRDASVVVNATPVGMHDDALPVAVGLLPRDAAVMDLVYRSGETAWVRAARASGHRAADGLVMLLAQGVRAFECWFGFAPDETAMRTALEA